MAKLARQVDLTGPSGGDPAAGTASVAPESSKAAKTRRSRDLAIRALARQHAAEAVAALAAVMNDPGATPAARVSAASALLNWGYGKPGQGPADGAGSGGRGQTEQVVRLVWGGETKS